MIETYTPMKIPVPNANLFPHSQITGSEVPQFVLDHQLRILEWNSALSVAFDRTMDLLKGKNIHEWLSLIDKDMRLLKRDLTKFNECESLNRLEDIQFHSSKYGILGVTKTAYAITEEANPYGWLVTMDLKFERVEYSLGFHQDLAREFRKNLMEYEYALAADKVLNNTTTYQELLQMVIGIIGPMGLIPSNTIVLDLGCGTGNIAKILTETKQGRTVFAVEKHAGILNVLKHKCQGLLSDGKKPGVVPIWQDATFLPNLQNNLADFALMNNVLYQVTDPIGCLREACRVLKRGGEIRISGPKKDTKINTLFQQIESELRARSQYNELQSDFEFIENFNKNVFNPILYRWTIKDVENLLQESGFSKILYKTENAYAGQGMIISARK